jgi:hypothetical protein
MQKFAVPANMKKIFDVSGHPNDAPYPQGGRF